MSRRARTRRRLPRDARSVRARPTIVGRIGHLPLDLAPADDRVPPVRVAHPGFVRSVVIRAEEDQRRLLAPNQALLRALRIDAAPDPDERVLLPLVADRR